MRKLSKHPLTKLFLLQKNRAIFVSSIALITMKAGILGVLP